MKWILCGQRFIGHQVIPVLATLLTRSAIPSPGQRLPATIWEQHQILLERCNAEGFGDDEVRDDAILPIGADNVALTLSSKIRGMATIRDRQVREIAKDVRLGGQGHGAGVITLLPRGRFRHVASGAGCRADKALTNRFCRARCIRAG